MLISFFFLYFPVPNAESLKIVDIELNVAQNTKEHHCDEYDITRDTDDTGKYQTPKLVVRRGQSFDITLCLNRPYNKDTDKVALQFAVGKYFSFKLLSDWCRNRNDQYSSIPEAIKILQT